MNGAENGNRVSGTGAGITEIGPSVQLSKIGI